MNNEIPKTILVEKILPRKGEEEKMYWNEYKIDIRIINNYNSNVQITYPEFQAFLQNLTWYSRWHQGSIFSSFLQEQFKFVNLSGSVETINIIQQHPKYCIKGKKKPQINSGGYCANLTLSCETGYISLTGYCQRNMVTFPITPLGLGACYKNGCVLILDGTKHIWHSFTLFGYTMSIDVFQMICSQWISFLHHQSERDYKTHFFPLSDLLVYF